jgi:hypothetical protein
MAQPDAGDRLDQHHAVVDVLEPDCLAVVREAAGATGRVVLLAGATLGAMTDDRQDARERMDRMRRDLREHDRAQVPTIDVIRSTRLVSDALIREFPDNPLGRKLAGCGRRNSVGNPLRCGSPACPRCMVRRGKRFAVDLMSELGSMPPAQLRWITILLFRDVDLDHGAIEMKKHHRRLVKVFSKFKYTRVWGCRELEREENGWLFHVHLLVDIASHDPDRIAEALRGAFGSGDRQVKSQPMNARSSQRRNLLRIALYMTKAKYHRSVDRHDRWLPDHEIAELALWRAHRVPLKWHRFTVGVRHSR